jgi:hypothetical protein
VDPNPRADEGTKEEASPRNRGNVAKGKHSDDAIVKNWLNQLDETSRQAYDSYWNRFFEGLKNQKGFEKITAAELLKMQRLNNGKTPTDDDPTPELKSHFDFSACGATSATHMLLLLSAADFLAMNCGAYVDACYQRVHREEVHKETDKRAADAYAVFRREEFSWEVMRAFSIEAETPTSLYNNKWTKQVSINARENFVQGFRGNIFVCFNFDIEKVRSIIGELPKELA